MSDSWTISDGAFALPPAQTVSVTWIPWWDRYGGTDRRVPGGPIDTGGVVASDWGDAFIFRATYLLPDFVTRTHPPPHAQVPVASVFASIAAPPARGHRVSLAAPWRALADTPGFPFMRNFDIIEQCSMHPRRRDGLTQIDVSIRVPEFWPPVPATDEWSASIIRAGITTGHVSARGTHVPHTLGGFVARSPRRATELVTTCAALAASQVHAVITSIRRWRGPPSGSAIASFSPTPIIVGADISAASRNGLWDLRIHWSAG